MVCRIVRRCVGRQRAAFQAGRKGERGVQRPLAVGIGWGRICVPCNLVVGAAITLYFIVVGRSGSCTPDEKLINPQKKTKKRAGEAHRPFFCTIVRPSWFAGAPALPESAALSSSDSRHAFLLRAFPGLLIEATDLVRLRGGGDRAGGRFPAVRVLTMEGTRMWLASGGCEWQRRGWKPLPRL